MAKFGANIGDVGWVVFWSEEDAHGNDRPRVEIFALLSAAEGLTRRLVSEVPDRRCEMAPFCIDGHSEWPFIDMRMTGTGSYWNGSEFQDWEPAPKDDAIPTELKGSQHHDG